MKNLKDPLILDKNYSNFYKTGDKSPHGVILERTSGNGYDVCAEAGATSYLTCGGCSYQNDCPAYELFRKGMI